jgi:hypothetical protein
VRAAAAAGDPGGRYRVPVAGKLRAQVPHEPDRVVAADPGRWAAAGHAFECEAAIEEPPLVLAATVAEERRHGCRRVLEADLDELAEFATVRPPAEVEVGEARRGALPAGGEPLRAEHRPQVHWNPEDVPAHANRRAVTGDVTGQQAEDLVLRQPQDRQGTDGGEESAGGPLEERHLAFRPGRVDRTCVPWCLGWRGRPQSPGEVAQRDGRSLGGGCEAVGVEVLGEGGPQGGSKHRQGRPLVGFEPGCRSEGGRKGHPAVRGREPVGRHGQDDAIRRSGGSLRLWWGQGKQHGGFVVIYDAPDGTAHQLFEVWTNGYIELFFKYLANKGPFADEALRRDLMARLNDIPGIEVPEAAVAKRPNVSFDRLPADASLDRFLAVFDWAIAEIRRAT